MKNIIKIGILMILVGVSFQPSQAMGQFFFMENENIGKPAPDFTLETLQGEEINFTEYRDGQKAIIFFWATWCPHCRKQLKLLKTTHAQFEEKGIRLVFVNQGEKPATILGYFRKHNMDFPVLLDPQSSLAEPYGLVGLPTFVFVDENGLVRDITHHIPENYEKIFSSK